jgi:hypothetical protein
MNSCVPVRGVDSSSTEEHNAGIQLVAYKSFTCPRASHDHTGPENGRPDDGPEFAAQRARDWMDKVSVKTMFIEPGSPWEHGFIEPFNGKLRDELPNREIFDTLLEAKVLIERWRVHYNTVRLHSSLGYKPPAPEAVLPSSHSNQITT